MLPIMSSIRRSPWLLVLLVLLSACTPSTAQVPTATPTPVATLTPTTPPTSTPLPTATATATANPSPTIALPTATPATTATLIAAQVVTPLPAPTSDATPILVVNDDLLPPETEQLSYVFPVQGAKVDYGSSHHDYPATDIFCAEGSRFVAPTSGVIDFTSPEDRWSPANDDPALRGGISVAMIGDDGVRYYGSHLSALAEGIAPGVRVEAGQLLGLTGKSGNARNTPPHVHFGISRPTTPDDWQVRRGQISPFPYLKAWQRGENMTPVLP
ncbi:M23 family metallopeptidase [Candidatus Oscillochloris fontis]|uniref:M23 family metallopeptidase n=1 Tax=Candidatus Oscillochloris fontis TaxID=2496868 RepID=UPI001EE9078F|nr:M23 family metallopeptidase [Candidatus Oscillochloris fontis]